MRETTKPPQAGVNKIKALTTQNAKPLSEEQRKMGSLKGRVQYYSEQLKCYFFLKKNEDFAEVEQRYLESKSRKLY